MIIAEQSLAETQFTVNVYNGKLNYATKQINIPLRFLPLISSSRISENTNDFIGQGNLPVR
jgi:hypothetical protein